MTKLIGFLASLALTFALVGTANAAVVNNVTDESEVSLDFFTSFKSDIRINQNASINNDVKALANSGHNVVKSDDDQTGTIITTGNAEAGAFVNNTANVVDIREEIGLPDFGGNNNEINNVHDESEVKVKVEDEIENDVDVYHDIWVDNKDVFSASNTGGNEVESDDSLHNTIITTGLAKATSAVENALNLVNIIKSRFVR